ncbi:peroxisomal sarcosine oxidase isoform 3-T3 [Morphnus guianensis]
MEMLPPGQPQGVGRMRPPPSPQGLEGGQGSANRSAPPDSAPSLPLARFPAAHGDGDRDEDRDGCPQPAPPSHLRRHRHRGRHPGLLRRLPPGPAPQGHPPAGAVHPAPLPGQLTRAEPHHPQRLPPSALCPHDARQLPPLAAAGGRGRHQPLQDVFRRHGGTLRDGEKVLRIDPGAMLTVTTTARAYRAPRLIIAAGAWTGALVAPLGLHLPLQPLRIDVCYWREKEPRSPSTGRAGPCFMALGLRRAPHGIYGLPALEYPGLVKVCYHHGSPTDPEERDGVPLGAPHPDIALLSSFISNYLPGLETRPAVVETCLYTVRSPPSSGTQAFGVPSLPSPQGGPCHAFPPQPWVQERTLDPTPSHHDSPRTPQMKTSSWTSTPSSATSSSGLASQVGEGTQPSLRPSTPELAGTMGVAVPPPSHPLLPTGHGFKLAPVVGKLLCELSLGEEPSHSTAPFAITRFPGVLRAAL